MEEKGYLSTEIQRPLLLRGNGSDHDPFGAQHTGVIGCNYHQAKTLFSGGMGPLPTDSRTLFLSVGQPVVVDQTRFMARSPGFLLGTSNLSRDQNLSQPKKEETIFPLSSPLSPED